MIKLLKGIVEYKDGTNLLIDVNGVGYTVYVSSSVLSSLNIGETAKVFTHLHVREDLLELYGFSSPEDLVLFEQLIHVSGIGPKTAIGIFSIGNREKIIQAIITNDISFFAMVPRLGKKNAQKIIIELKNKIDSLGSASTALPNGDDDEVITALKDFGFSNKEIYNALQTVGDEKSVSEKIRLALKRLGK